MPQTAHSLNSRCHMGLLDRSKEPMWLHDGSIQFVGTVGVSGGTADQDVPVGEARVKAA